MAEFKVEVPGTYINVDHAIFRIAKGAVGLIKVEGAEQPEIYKGLKQSVPDDTLCFENICG